MKTAIFIKTFHKDYSWLVYCLKSIARFATGFSEIVVVTDADEQRPPIGTAETWHPINRMALGYIWQQIVKLNADKYTDADFILYMDADTIFTQPITPETLMIDGKPIWLHESYVKLADPQASARQPSAEKFVGKPVEHEFMRRHPHIIDRRALHELREYCRGVHHLNIAEYAQQDPLFSEFNIMGAYLYHHHPEMAVFKQPEEVQTYVWQGYSWGGLNDDLRVHLERALQ